MDRFKIFCEAMKPKDIVAMAVEARGDIECSRFGDCGNVSRILLKDLEWHGIKAKLEGGVFVYDLLNEEYFEHTWVRVNRYALDPTIDQFFSALDVDLHTKIHGIYYSHPQWDGDWLVKRYRKGGNWD